MRNDSNENAELLKLTSEIVSAYVRWSQKIGQAVKVYSTG